jgi:hypothetical protein
VFLNRKTNFLQWEFAPKIFILKQMQKKLCFVFNCSIVPKLKLNKMYFRTQNCLKNSKAHIKQCCIPHHYPTYLVSNMGLVFNLYNGFANTTIEYNIHIFQWWQITFLINILKVGCPLRNSQPPYNLWHPWTKHFA